VSTEDPGDHASRPTGDLSRKALGAHGEARTARWYRAQGYEVLARNWSCREGELDLIVGKAGVIVFCEVKTRRSTAFGIPAEAVTHDKRRRIRRLAARWLEEEGPHRPREIRFDVASVLRNEVEVIEGAF
jgi:putative endonuclease